MKQPAMFNQTENTRPAVSIGFVWCDHRGHKVAAGVCDHNLGAGKCVRHRRGCKPKVDKKISEEERQKRSERMKNLRRIPGRRERR